MKLIVLFHLGVVISVSSFGQGLPPTITGQPGVNVVVCEGSIGYLTVTATNATSYQWYTSAGVAVPVGASYSGVNTATLGINTTGGFGNGALFYCRVANAYGSKNSSNGSLLVHTLPAAPGVTNGFTCGPGTVTLNATGGTAGEYRWYDYATGALLLGQYNSAYTTPSLTTSTNYQVAIYDGTCFGPKSLITASVYAVPASPGVVNAAICGPGSVTLGATGAKAGQFLWYTAAGVAISGQTNGTYTTPSLSATTNYLVSIFNGSCESTRMTVTATINAVPTAPGATGNSACGSNAITLNATGGTAGQYLWYTSAGTLISGQTNSSYTTPVLTTTTNYSVSIYNGTCESAKTAVTATINTIPGTPGTTGNSACGPSAITLTATGGTAGQYRWYSSAGVAISGQTASTYTTPVLTTTTSYQVSINNGFCEGAKASVTATINTVPAAPGATGNSACGSGAITLNATGGTAGQYRWYNSAGVAISGQTASSYTTPVITTTTIYSVSINNGLCESTKTSVSAVINGIPATPSATGNSSCGPGAITLSVSGGSAGQYRWYQGGVQIAGQTNSTYTTPIISATSNYGVAINNGTCEGAQATVTATVNSVPAAPGVAGSYGCGTSSVILTANGAAAGQYRWYSGGTLITGQTNSTYSTPSLTTTTNYTVSINNGTCESSQVIVIATIRTPPSAPVASGSSSCATTALALSAAGATDGQYRWYNSDGTSISGAVNSSYITPVISVTTIYYVSINDGFCEGPKASATASINSVFSTPSVTGGSSCGPGAVSLLASGALDGQYRWYTDQSGTTPIAGAVNGTFVTPVITATTTYYVAINNGSCEGGRSPVVAQVNTVPSAPTTTGHTICAGVTVVLNASGGSDGQYRWYTSASGGSAISDETSSSLTTPVLQTTTIYYVSIYNGTCESARTPVTAAVTATCNNAPPDILTVTSITVPGGTVMIGLDKLVSDPDNNLDLSSLKVIGQTKSGVIPSLDEQGNLTLDYSGLAFAGTDSVRIQVCDLDKACTERVFTIDVDGDIVVFNGFSPNGDGINDIWIIGNIESLQSTKSNHVSIFDRWGDVVFEVDNYDNSGAVFTGKNKSGGDLQSGIYFYKIEYTAGRKTDSGYVSLKH